MGNANAPILFTHKSVPYYALADLIDDPKKILSFDNNDLLREVRILGQNIHAEELAVQLERAEPAKIGITKKGIKLLKQYATSSLECPDHDFTLPSEIWHQIIELVAADDVWSAARCQFINKELHDIARNDLTWRSVYEDWTKTESDPNLTDWYTRFVKEALWTRKVQLNDVVSRYNEQYYCEVKAVEFTAKTITLHIDEHGNNSLGEIQDPKSSRLSIAVGTYPSTPSKLIHSEFEVADPKLRYLGVLGYQASYAIGGAYSFCYGVSYGGYQEVKLFDLTSEFIHNYKLQHIIDRWSKGSKHLGVGSSPSNKKHKN